MDEGEERTPGLPPGLGALLQGAQTWAVPPPGLEADVLAALRRER